MISRYLYVAAMMSLMVAAPSRTASAAELTQVADALDGDKPWDGILGVRFVHTQRTALILREWICNSQDGVSASTGANPLCPGGNEVLNRRELAFSETMNVLNIDLRAGLWKDFEFYMTLPIIVGWQSSLNYDTGVSGGNSSVDGPLIQSLFGVPFESPTRVGFGDLVLGFKIAPFHADRDSAYPSWVLGVEYTAPTGEARTAGTSSVGSAVHALRLFTAISRPFDYVEPYFQAQGVLRFPSSSGPFQNERITQTLVSPGASLGLLLGTEIHPWKKPDEDGEYIAIDLRFSAGFTFEGREYTELFDALGTSACDPASGCGRTVLTRGERTPEGAPRTTDGVTDVEQYGTFGAGVGVTYQAFRYLKFRLAFDYRYTTSHFLTFADAGKDLDGNGAVTNGTNQGDAGLNEYSPFYNASYDEAGRRFRLDDKNSYQVTFAIEGQF